jgi:hypothetical protein
VSNKTAPAGHRLSSDRLIRFQIILKLFEVGRIEMVVDCGLVGELLIEHELRRILRIKVKFVDETAWLLVSGSHERMQLGSEFFFMTRGCLEVNIEDDRGFRHDFRNELWVRYLRTKFIYFRF